MPNLEILVHISASCRIQDDRKYRNIANAALSFKPISKVLVTGECTDPNAATPGDLKSSNRQHESLFHEGRTLATRLSTDSSESNMLAAGKRKRKLSETCEIESDKIRDCSRLSSELTPSTFNKSSIPIERLPALSQPNSETPVAEIDSKDISRVIDSYECTFPWFSQMQRRINSLGACVHCPNNVATCRVTQKRTTQQLYPFEHHVLTQRTFMPTHIARAIHKWERGYWLLPIIISTDALVVEWRSSAQEQRPWPVGVNNSDYPWTTDEFMNFWHETTTRILASDLGFVSLYRHEAIAAPDLATPDSLLVRLRLYCWGEVVPRLYLVLRDISAGLLDHVASEWTGSDGRAIIMIGGGRNAGTKPGLVNH